MTNKLWLHALFLLLLFKIGESQSIIKTLPGYSGTLPIKLETGYIGVGENDEVQLFYYFIESERSPRQDPLLVWFNGGPGCSGLSGLLFEIGPLNFDIANFDGSLPSILLNPYSWTKVANIIFLDSPVGTGFSYSNTSQGYSSSDTKSAKDSYTFIRKWLLNHPMFIKNSLYVAGDSYGGKLVPMIALEILRGNEAGLQPRMSLRGYIIGNPKTDQNIENNAQVPYAHRMALISDDIFEATKISCNGEYDNPDPNNLQCLLSLRSIHECINPLDHFQILEPECTNPYLIGWNNTFREDFSTDHLFLPSEKGGMRCRYDTYVTSEVWANDPTVQEALHVRKAAKISYNGEYGNPDPNNLQCLLALLPIHECIDPLEEEQILEPKCANPNLIRWNHTFREDFSIDHLLLPSEKGEMRCRNENYVTSYVWANDPTVQEALHVRKGTILGWTRCSHSLSYEMNVQSVVQYHKLLSNKGYPALVYSGDHDMAVPYTSTLKWIRSLNMTVEDNWRPWFVNGQVAGYTQNYKNIDSYLTFVTVKGAGHVAPQFKPRECFVMLDRWLSLYPL